MNSLNWSVVLPEIVLLTMACVVAMVDLFVTDPMNEHQPSCGDRGRRVACAFRKFPDERRRQRPTQFRFSGNGVLRGSQKSSPVVSDRPGRQRLRLGDDPCLTTSNARHDRLNENGLQQRPAGDEIHE